MNSDNVMLKVYLASGFQNRTMLQIVRTFIENTHFNKQVNGEKRKFTFDVISTWIDHYSLNLDECIHEDFDQVEESDIVIAFWPWSSGTVSELTYAIEKKNVPVLLFIDDRMVMDENPMNIYTPVLEYFSLLVPFSLIRRYEDVFNAKQKMASYDDFYEVPMRAKTESNNKYFAYATGTGGLTQFLEKTCDYYRDKPGIKISCDK